MPNSEWLFDLAEEVRDLIEPLETGLSDVAAFSRLLERYGLAVDPQVLNLHDLQQRLTILEDLVAASALSRDLLTAKDSAPAIETYIELIDVLVGIVGRVRRADLTAPGGIDAELWARFVTELPSGLVADYLESHHAAVWALLILLGIVVETRVAGGDVPGSIGYTRRELFWDRTLQSVADLRGLMRDLYAWDDAERPFDHHLLFERLIRSAWLLGIPAELDTPPAELLDAYYSDANPDRSLVQSIRLWLIAGANGQGDEYGYSVRLLPIPPAWDRMAGPSGLLLTPSITLSAVRPSLVVWPFSLEYSGFFRSEGAIRIEIYPDRVGAELGELGESEVDAALAAIFEERRPTIVVGSRFSHRLQTRRARLRLRLAGPVDDPELELELALEEAQLVIDGLDRDSFLNEILGTGPGKFEFDVGIVWSSKSGLHLRGSGALALSAPLNVNLGVVDLESLDLGLAGSPDGLALTVGISGHAQIGPLAVSVQNMGVALTLTPVGRDERAGVFGDLDLSFDFKPPDGLGVTIDAGAIAGGGFLSFDQPNARYAGVLQLDVYGVAVSAVGLLDTKLPGGAPGFSFLIIISTEFVPIQLGFGFTLNGVGGLAGIHRTLVVDALQADIRNESIDALLFPDDPVANAPRLISDLRAYFPPAEGRYVFGPMALIGWGTPMLLEAKLGILLETPDPVRLVVLGQISAHFPTEEAAVVELHIDALGVIDFGEKRLAIDARLHDSRVALFAISGDMALRLAWGDSPVFVLSLGGFNPRFTPPPAFPELQRLTIALGLDENPRIGLQAYLALTSNSLQLGAKAELLATAGDFSLYGWITFDALVIFSPFYFIVDFSAGVALRWDGDTIAGIHVNATLEGPAPWHAWGEACLSLLFFDICVDFDARFGEGRRTELPPSDPWPALQAAISDPRNWSASLSPAAFRVVTFIAPEATPPVLVDPVGSLTLRETVVPLNRRITKFGETTPAAPARYDILSVAVGDEPVAWSTVQADFAAGQFLTLSDDEKLTRKAFEKMDAGVELASDAVSTGAGINATVEYETVIIDSPWERRTADRYQLPLRHQRAMLGRGAAARAALRRTGLAAFASMPDRAPSVALAEETYVIASTTDLRVREDIMGPGTQSDAYEALASYLAAHPAEREALQVIPEHEQASAA